MRFLRRELTLPMWQFILIVIGADLFAKVIYLLTLKPVLHAVWPELW